MTIAESVRDYDVYILNTVSKRSFGRRLGKAVTDLGQCAGQVNTSLLELCIMIHACKVKPENHYVEVSSDSS